MSTYNTVSLIRKKRDKQNLSPEEIRWMIAEYTHDRIPDYQMSAFLMAVFLNGMDAGESAALTDAMLHSGKVLDLSAVPGIKVDKHSTGGVGDKLSLILAPVAAACGVPVPMISGRGLGHSGGTLDKLESIPGFNVNLNLNAYENVLRKHNIVLIGQTEDIAPADKRMYALRDVTATIECIPLIAASIMSKKLAEGIDALVLDVKFGSGAFMKTVDQARTLAQTLVDIGNSAGKKTVVWLTGMDQPLGHAIGNWLEVRESIDTLRGEGPEDVTELSLRLAGTMIWLGGKAESVEEGIETGRRSIENGTALQKFIDVVEEQGGDTDLIRHPERYRRAAVVAEVTAAASGYIAAIDSYELGMAALELGAGRRRKEDTIDPVAGILLRKKIGDPVIEGAELAQIHTSRTETSGIPARIRDAIRIEHHPPPAYRLIAGQLGMDT